ncbi:hypothetical protein Esti_001722 [Eimeria stiedai]
MDLRWGVCSMQGWRVSMEDAHLVLYAKRIGAAAAAAGSKTHHAQQQQQQQQHEEGGEGVAAQGMRPSVGGPHLLSQLMSNFAGGGFSHRPLVGYRFLPVDCEQPLYSGHDLPAAAASSLRAAAAGGVDDDGGAELLVEGPGTEAPEAEGEGPAAAANKKGSKITKSVLRQFSRRRKAPATAAATAASATPHEQEAQGESTGSGGGGPLGGPQGMGAPCDAAAVAAAFSSSKGAVQTQASQQADLCIFAVFDGHGGAHVSRFAAAHLQALLDVQPAFHRGEFAAALRAAYLQIDDLLRQEVAQDELLFLTTHTPHQLLLHKQMQQQQQQQQQQHEHHHQQHEHVQQQESDGGNALPQHKGLRSTLTTIGQHFGVRSQQQQQQQQQQQRGPSSSSGSGEKLLGKATRGGDDDPAQHEQQQQEQQQQHAKDEPSSAAAACPAAAAAADSSSSKGGGDGATPRSFGVQPKAASFPAAAAEPHAAAAAAAPAAVAASDAGAVVGAAAGEEEGDELGGPTGDDLVSPRKNKRGSLGVLMEAVSKSFGLGRFFSRNNPNSAATSRSLANTAGCTALTVCVTPTSIVVANVGDSRCVLCRGSEILELSQDHKPQLAEERIRIYAAGGYLEMGRVNGNLNLSRALGDLAYKSDCTLPPEKQILSGSPDIVSVQRDPLNDDFLIIGCDGIWELLSSAEVVEFVRRRIEHTDDLCQILKDLFDSLLSPNPALFEYGCDNMTAFIVDLKAEQRQRQIPVAAAPHQQRAGRRDSSGAPPLQSGPEEPPSQSSSTESLPGSSRSERGSSPHAEADTTLQQQQQQQQAGWKAACAAAVADAAAAGAAVKSSSTSSNVAL